MKQQMDCTRIDRLASLLAAVIVSGGLGCAKDPVSPSTPELAAATAAAVSFTTVSAGGSHTCALAADGRVYCWGWNENGQLGDGTRTSHSSPKAVAGTLRFVQVSAGA